MRLFEVHNPYNSIEISIIAPDGFKIMEVELIEPELFLLNGELQNNFKQAINWP